METRSYNHEAKLEINEQDVHKKLDSDDKQDKFDFKKLDSMSNRMDKVRELKKQSDQLQPVVAFCTIIVPGYTLENEQNQVQYYVTNSKDTVLLEMKRTLYQDGVIRGIDDYENMIGMSTILNMLEHITDVPFMKVYGTFTGIVSANLSSGEKKFNMLLGIVKLMPRTDYRISQANLTRINSSLGSIPGLEGPLMIKAADMVSESDRNIVFNTEFSAESKDILRAKFVDVGMYEKTKALQKLNTMATKNSADRQKTIEQFNKFRDNPYFDKMKEKGMANEKGDINIEQVESDESKNESKEREEDVKTEESEKLSNKYTSGGKSKEKDKTLKYKRDDSKKINTVIKSEDDKIEVQSANDDKMKTAQDSLNSIQHYVNADLNDIQKKEVIRRADLNETGNIKLPLAEKGDTLDFNLMEIHEIGGVFNSKKEAMWDQLVTEIAKKRDLSEDKKKKLNELWQKAKEKWSEESSKQTGGRKQNLKKQDKKSNANDKKSEEDGEDSKQRETEMDEEDDKSKKKKRKGKRK